MANAGILGIDQRGLAYHFDGFGHFLHLQRLIESGGSVDQQTNVFDMKGPKPGCLDGERVSRRRDLKKLIEALIIGLGCSSKPDRGIGQCYLGCGNHGPF